MARKYKLTRPELKRQRDALARFQRYLPMLKLKQQQLQLTVREVEQSRRKLQSKLQAARDQFEPYSALLNDTAGVDVRSLAKPQEVQTSAANVAGVNIHVFQEAIFPPAAYSLFATPPWVDRVLADLRKISDLSAQLDVMKMQYELLRRELTKIIQRVNLFEKIKIPEAAEAIRVIRIKLGDEMTAAVGRAKIAKAKISESGSFNGVKGGAGQQVESAATS